MNLVEIKQAAIDYALAEFTSVAREKDIPGIAFGLILKGELIFTAGVGETKIDNAITPTADSIFRIASLSKSFTADAILLLRNRGLLRLEDPMSKHLPWCSTMGAPEVIAALTIRDLLTMGGGFPTDDPWGDRQEDIPLQNLDSLVAAGITFNRFPNTGFEYSNLGYALLGRIISVVSGEDFEVFMKREIQDQYGLTSSTYFTDEVSEEVRVAGYAKFDSGLTLEPTTRNGGFTPMGGLHSSVSELAKWVAQFQSGKPEAQLPARHAQSKLAKAQDDIPERIITTHYGYGLFIDDDAELGRFISHSGGYPGFGSHMRWHPQSGWGIVALANLTYAPMSITSTKIMNYIANLYKEKSPADLDMNDATKSAMGAVEMLLESWDESIADSLFCMNMDLDEPRAQRRAEVESLSAKFGPFVMIDGSVESSTRSHAKWKVQGSTSQLHIEILMSPEKNPTIQKLTILEVSAIRENI